MRSSIEKVKNTLPGDKKELFEGALKIILFDKITPRDIVQTKIFDTGATQRKIKEALHEKNAEQIIKEARAILKRKEAEHLRKEQEAQRLKEERQLQQVKKALAIQKQAIQLKKDGQLCQALSKYQEIMAIDEIIKLPNEITVNTKEAIEELNKKISYLEKVEIHRFEATHINTLSRKNIPAVRFKLNNTGDRNLNKVSITIYFKNAIGKIIKEKNYHPIFVTEYKNSRNTKPLEAGHSWDMPEGEYYTIDDMPSEWQDGEAEIKVTDLEFVK